MSKDVKNPYKRQGTDLGNEDADFCMSGDIAEYKISNTEFHYFIRLKSGQLIGGRDK